MTDGINRRTLLTSAGLATAAIVPALARTQAALAEHPHLRTQGANQKQALEIPADNSIFAASHGAYEKYGYSPAVRAGGLLFIAGQVGVRPDGTVPASVAEQTEWALRQTGEILRLEGITFDNLVDVVSYHVDLAHHVDDFLAVKARYIKAPFPAWSIIGVQALAKPGLLIEIRSVATLG